MSHRKRKAVKDPTEEVKDPKQPKTAEDLVLEAARRKALKVATFIDVVQAATGLHSNRMLAIDLLSIVADYADADDAFAIQELRSPGYGGWHFGGNTDVGVDFHFYVKIENSVTGRFVYSSTLSMLPFDSGERDVLCIYNTTDVVQPFNIRRVLADGTKSLLAQFVPPHAFLRFWPLLPIREDHGEWHMSREYQNRMLEWIIRPQCRLSTYERLQEAKRRLAFAVEEHDNLAKLDPLRPPFYMED